MAHILEKDLPSELKKYARALNAFNKVRVAAFGEHLGSSLEADVAQFRSCYMELLIPITPKVHIIIDHLVDFCKRHGSALGPFSEQASESVHADFSQIWQHYRVAPNHDRFADKLLSAVVKYNSLHV